MTSGKKNEFVSLYGLILWLLEKELNSNVDIYKAYNNVGHHLTRLFLYNKNYSFFRVSVDIATKTEKIQKLPDNAIQVIADFLKNIKTMQHSNCSNYKRALLDLDLVLAVQNVNVSTLHKIEATPNYTLYDEIGNILQTFTNSRVVTDHVELFLSSLLRRWGNPKIYKYCIERIEDFKTAEFVKCDYSNTLFAIVLNSDLINLNQNIGKSTLEIDQLKKENEKLKAELAEKDQKIKELESLKPKNDMDLLSLIFNESATEVYAPDLANAIKLWKHLYVENKGVKDSHSSRANHWIDKNTPYKGESSVEVKRLREVTSPFNSWHNERKIKLNK